MEYIAYIERAIRDYDMVLLVTDGFEIGPGQGAIDNIDLQDKKILILSSGQPDVIVCIAARAYGAMARQLIQLGYAGRIEKLVDYDSYADYSLSEETIANRKEWGWLPGEASRRT